MNNYDIGYRSNRRHATHYPTWRVTSLQSYCCASPKHVGLEACSPHQTLAHGLCGPDRFLRTNPCNNHTRGASIITLTVISCSEHTWIYHIYVYMVNIYIYGVYIYIYVCVCYGVYIYICYMLCIYVYMVCIYIYVCVCVRGAFIFIYIYIWCIYVCVCGVYIYIYTQLWIYICDKSKASSNDRYAVCPILPVESLIAQSLYAIETLAWLTGQDVVMQYDAMWLWLQV